MAEKIEAVVTDITDSAVDAQSGLKRFTVNHPRTAKIVGYGAITAAALGGLAWWNARKQTDFDDVDGTLEDDSFDAKSDIA